MFLKKIMNSLKLIEIEWSVVVIIWCKLSVQVLHIWFKNFYVSQVLFRRNVERNLLAAQLIVKSMQRHRLDTSTNWGEELWNFSTSAKTFSVALQLQLMNIQKPQEKGERLGESNRQSWSWWVLRPVRVGAVPFTRRHTPHTGMLGVFAKKMYFKNTPVVKFSWLKQEKRLC